MRQRNWVYILLVVFSSLCACGCETAGAFGTGRMTAADVAYITHAGTLGKTTTPVDVDSLDADQNCQPSAAPGVSEPKSISKMSKADAWLEENLW